MGYFRNRGGRRGGGGAVPPFVDRAFAEALEDGGGRRRCEREGSSRKREHKAGQLCRQVQRAIGLALAGECGDDVLRDVYVEAVESVPGGAHLLVRVVVPGGVPMAEALARLEAARGRLRASVARAISRKRVPELLFVPVWAGEAGGVQ